MQKSTPQSQQQGVIKMDRLRQDYINSLPQPFLIVQWDGTKWPLIEICVETGFLAFDACGMRQPDHIGNVRSFIDADGVAHDADTFYSDYLEGDV